MSAGQQNSSITCCAGPLLGEDSGLLSEFALRSIVGSGIGDAKVAICLFLSALPISEDAAGNELPRLLSQAAMMCPIVNLIEEGPVVQRQLASVARGLAEAPKERGSIATLQIQVDEDVAEGEASQEGDVSTRRTTVYSFVHLPLFSNDQNVVNWCSAFLSCSSHCCLVGASSSSLRRADTLRVFSEVAVKALGCSLSQSISVRSDSPNQDNQSCLICHELTFAFFGSDHSDVGFDAFRSIGPAAETEEYLRAVFPRRSSLVLLTPITQTTSELLHDDGIDGVSAMYHESLASHRLVLDLLGRALFTSTVTGADQGGRLAVREGLDAVNSRFERICGVQSPVEDESELSVRDQAIADSAFQAALQRYSSSLSAERERVRNSPDADGSLRDILSLAGQLAVRTLRTRLKSSRFEGANACEIAQRELLPQLQNTLSHLFTSALTMERSGFTSASAHERYHQLENQVARLESVSGQNSVFRRELDTVAQIVDEVARVSDALLESSHEMTRIVEQTGRENKQLVEAMQKQSAQLRKANRQAVLSTVISIVAIATAAMGGMAAYAAMTAAKATTTQMAIAACQLAGSVATVGNNVCSLVGVDASKVFRPLQVVGAVGCIAGGIQSLAANGITMSVGTVKAVTDVVAGSGGLAATAGNANLAGTLGRVAAVGALVGGVSDLGNSLDGKTIVLTDGNANVLAAAKSVDLVEVSKSLTSTLSNAMVALDKDTFTANNLAALSSILQCVQAATARASEEALMQELSHSIPEGLKDQSSGLPTGDTQQKSQQQRNSQQKVPSPDKEKSKPTASSPTEGQKRRKEGDSEKYARKGTALALGGVSSVGGEGTPELSMDDLVSEVLGRSGGKKTDETNGERVPPWMKLLGCVPGIDSATEGVKGAATLSTVADCRGGVERIEGQVSPDPSGGPVASRSESVNRGPLGGLFDKPLNMLRATGVVLDAAGKAVSEDLSPLRGWIAEAIAPIETTRYHSTVCDADSGKCTVTHHTDHKIFKVLNLGTSVAQDGRVAVSPGLSLGSASTNVFASFELGVHPQRGVDGAVSGGGRFAGGVPASLGASTSLYWDDLSLGLSGSRGEVKTGYDVNYSLYEGRLSITSDATRIDLKTKDEFTVRTTISRCDTRGAEVLVASAAVMYLTGGTASIALPSFETAALGASVRSAYMGTIDVVSREFGRTVLAVPLMQRVPALAK